jgi:hypothetical protein
MTEILRSYQVDQPSSLRAHALVSNPETKEVLFCTDASSNGMDMVQGEDRMGPYLGSLKFPLFFKRIEFTMPDGNDGVWKEEMIPASWWGARSAYAFTVATANGARGFEWKPTRNLTSYGIVGKHRCNLQLVDSVNGTVYALFEGSQAWNQKGWFRVLQDLGLGPQGDIMMILTGLGMYSMIFRRA